jgi:hypothetical protein
MILLARTAMQSNMHSDVEVEISGQKNPIIILSRHQLHFGWDGMLFIITQGVCMASEITQWYHLL